MEKSLLTSFNNNIDVLNKQVVEDGYEFFAKRQLVGPNLFNQLKTVSES